jgi:glycosyltransferase involved in cell wall biosynthesis
MKKVLIITYYWPPSGGPGVQRVLKFVKYLPEFGWQPVILTVRNGEYPAIDESLVSEVPQELKVVKTKSLEPFSFYRMFTGKNAAEPIPTYILNKVEKEKLRQSLSKWIRANLFLPDAKIGWLPFAINAGKKIIKDHNIDAIISSSPPHTVQLIAKKLACNEKIRWIADFRDPWTDAFWLKDMARLHLANRIDSALERKVLRKAGILITVSEALARLFESRSKTKCSVIHNGYDPDDFYNIPATVEDIFKITYIGNLAKSQRIDSFLSALKTILPQLSDQIEVNFYGNIHQDTVNKIYEMKLHHIIKINPYIPHDEVVKIMCQSNILLLVIPDVPDNKGILTGKIFEYLAAKKYILGIGPEQGDAARILSETNCGRMHDYNDPLKEIIFEQYQNWKSGMVRDINEKKIAEYSRKNLTRKLVQLLEME